MAARKGFPGAVPPLSHTQRASASGGLLAADSPVGTPSSARAEHGNDEIKFALLKLKVCLQLSA